MPYSCMAIGRASTWSAAKPGDGAGGTNAMGGLERLDDHLVSTVLSHLNPTTLRTAARAWRGFHDRSAEVTQPRAASGADLCCSLEGRFVTKDNGSRG